MVDLLFDGRHDLFILHKYEGGAILDPEDALEVERLENVGLMLVSLNPAGPTVAHSVRFKK